MAIRIVSGKMPKVEKKEYGYSVPTNIPHIDEKKILENVERSAEIPKEARRKRLQQDFGTTRHIWTWFETSISEED